MEKYRKGNQLKGCFENIPAREVHIMEVCGTHTRVITKSGIRYLLPKEIMLLSGPGCPVCVTPESYIDMALEALELEKVLLVTFGDMLKVKGTRFSLAEQQAEGSQILVVYSPEEILAIAAEQRDKSVLFLAVGFETTAPLFAVIVKRAKEVGLDNLFLLTALKRMEPVIRFLLQDNRCRIDAMICPGHVASIIGADEFRFITEEFGVPAAICGFEAHNILTGIEMLVAQLSGRTKLEFVNLYQCCVRPNGNVIARQMMEEVFDVVDGEWRGIGILKKSALILNNDYKQFDAVLRFGLKAEKHIDPTDCLCGEILLGLKLPEQCSRFGSACSPEHPLGPCMVSSEGSCAVYFKYRMDR